MILPNFLYPSTFQKGLPQTPDAPSSAAPLLPGIETAMSKKHISLLRSHQVILYPVLARAEMCQRCSHLEGNALPASAIQQQPRALVTLGQMESLPWGNWQGYANGSAYCEPHLPACLHRLAASVGWFPPIAATPLGSSEPCATGARGFEWPRVPVMVQVCRSHRERD